MNKRMIVAFAFAAVLLFFGALMLVGFVIDRIRTPIEYYGDTLATTFKTSASKISVECEKPRLYLVNDRFELEWKASARLFGQEFDLDLEADGILEFDPTSNTFYLSKLDVSTFDVGGVDQAELQVFKDRVKGAASHAPPKVPIYTMDGSEIEQEVVKVILAESDVGTNEVLAALGF